MTVDIYINGICISNEDIKKIKVDAVIAQYDFAQQRNLDEYIVFDNIDAKNEDIKKEYVKCGGEINELAGDIMVQLLFKYPMYVSMKDKYVMTLAQIKSYIKHVPCDILFHEFCMRPCVSHYEFIIDQIKRRDNIYHILEWRQGCEAQICCSKEAYGIVPYIDEIFVPYIVNTIPAKLRNNKIVGDKVMLSKHPFGYHDGMREIRSNNDLIYTLKCNKLRDLYINCNIDCCICDHIDVKYVNPEVFATWMIGPKCRKLINLFRNYTVTDISKYICKWNVMGVLIINRMFKEANVRDLSMWYLKCCTDATNAFSFSTIKKPPRFDALKICDSLFRDCKYLEDAPHIKTDNIVEITGMFAGCSALKNALNNCVFSPKLNKIRFVFKGCSALESAFNNCKFAAINIELIKVFNGCNIFNNCGKIHTKGQKLKIHTEGTKFVKH